MPKSILTFLALLAVLLLTSACSNSSFKKFPFIQDEAPVQKKTEEPADKPLPTQKKIEEPADKSTPAAVRKAEQELNLGIRSYEDGQYKTAAGHLQNALGDGSLSVGDQITAHKFLAFIYCVSGEKLACRGAFKKVLALNSRFELSASEVGHPIWGPVFREVQAEAAGKKKR
ncbi:MAG: TssQ family T6SS-associated lipoprotein [Gammaproteobacteria bacterium]|nr:TssQ family T6SS-associated lipoprotein [Gammaproteobacteria bacterium]MBU1731938.1 TssQ family T6SS-associated lipoprotein [Gammaproteobacteria bacterium]MBU1893076.1 TssQ family T6SS-associated lipoprotein [Gammaproteobacteria bacterium]